MRRTDPTTLELFGRMVDRIKSLSALLIVTFRPEFNPPSLRRTYVTAVTINRLAERDISVLIVLEPPVGGNKPLPSQHPTGHHRAH